ncbi:MAG TPA: MarR family transcriptional regulator [Mycobacteriales bacterium]|nr:MarR family transcriptional regulator [Mycobacteriales bacterium]
MASSAEPADRAVETEIIDHVNGLVGRVWAQFTARVAELGLSMPEAKALQALEPDQDVPMRTIAARLHANPSNVTVVVSRLEGRGLITRSSADDRRVKGVRLTEAGLALRDRLTDRIAVDHPAVAGLSANQRESLLRILRRLTQHAEP